MTQKLTKLEFLEAARLICLKKGGKLKSKIYVNAKSKLEVQCSKKHIFYPSFDNLKKGTWCPSCSKNRAITDDMLISKVKQNGGKFICRDKADSKKSKVSCKKKHIFVMRNSSIIRGDWCPKCAHEKNCENLRTGIKYFIELAESKGGKCLSTEYVNGQTKLKFLCDKGHTFLKTPSGMKAGFWCEFCETYRGIDYNKKLKEICDRNRGKVFGKYINSKTKLIFECSEGHKWSAIPQSILKGYWCRLCANRKLSLDRKNSIEKVIINLQKLNYSLLSTEYFNNWSLIKVQCSNGHISKRSYSNILTQPKCPKCYGYRGEEIVRLYFEYIFDLPFEKVRPEWLINNKGKRLELDGYNEDLKIAFEHQGRQHKVNAFKNSNLEQIKEHDQIKKKILKRMGIVLIEVPSVGYEIDERALLKYILNKIPDSKKSLIKKIPLKSLEINESKISNIQKYFPKLVTKVKEKNGEIIKGQYINAKSKFKIKCDKGHLFQNTFEHIVNRNQWCPHKNCRKVPKKRHTIEQFKKIAEKYDGNVLSASYDGFKTKLDVYCKKHGEFKVSPILLLRGCWCTKCAHEMNSEKLRTGLGYFINFAILKGGECLSTTYVNSHTKLKFRCGKGHVFESLPTNIMSHGSWCQKCANSK